MRGKGLLLIVVVLVSLVVVPVVQAGQPFQPPVYFIGDLVGYDKAPVVEAWVTLTLERSRGCASGWPPNLPSGVDLIQYGPAKVSQASIYQVDSQLKYCLRVPWDDWDTPEVEGLGWYCGVKTNRIDIFVNGELVYSFWNWRGGTLFYIDLHSPPLEKRAYNVSFNGLEGWVAQLYSLRWKPITKPHRFERDGWWSFHGVREDKVYVLLMKELPSGQWVELARPLLTRVGNLDISPQSQSYGPDSSARYWPLTVEGHQN